MNDRTSSKERIARIEEVPLIYGSISSGAEGRYITKKNFPKLFALAEGGYATDIFLKIDEKRERVIIEDILSENYDSFKDEMMEGANDFLGILDSGVSSGLEKALENVGNDNKAVFWCNGIWSIMQEHFQENDLFIPVELASRIINRAGISNKNDLLSSLDAIKFENEKFDSVSAKQLADILDMGDLYSIWKYDNRITCMLNTDMKDGPYKIQRIYDKVDIKVSVKFIHNESNTSGTVHFKLKDIVSKEDYENAIIQSFKAWSGNYKEEEYAKFGNNPINITVDILKEGFNKDAVIEIINSNSNSNRDQHVSNVECENGKEWKISYIGKMTEYNHHEFEPIDDKTYRKEAKHEFGHFMGLGDAYNGALASKEVSIDDIMWSGEKVSSNDIEMLLMAALKNKKQYFYSNEGKIISEAITV